MKKKAEKKALVYSRVKEVYFISKEKIPLNLRRKIAEWARRGRMLYGPIEIKALRECKNHYSIDLVLRNCVEDEMGAHNCGFRNMRFEKPKKK